MMDCRHDSTLEYYYNAIEDTQNTIRFTDTKAGVVLVCSGLLVAFFVPMGKALLQHINDSSTTFLQDITFLFGIAFFIAILIAIVTAFKAINPSSAPTSHINTGGVTTSIPFYLYGISPKMKLIDQFVERNELKLKHVVGDYFNVIKNSKDINSEILKSLILQHHIVSYIREKKIYRTSRSILFFEIAVLLLIGYGILNFISA